MPTAPFDDPALQCPGEGQLLQQRYDAGCGRSLGAEHGA